MGRSSHEREFMHAASCLASMTDKCEYCGDSLADDWVACPKCGKPKYGGKPLVEIASKEDKR
jgi:rubrerythrin